MPDQPPELSAKSQISICPDDAASRGGHFGLCLAQPVIDTHSQPAGLLLLGWSQQGRHIVLPARLASGVEWTNGWPTHTTLAPWQA